MSNKKQSSVEWLFVELWNTPKDKFEWQSIFEQAKAMHKDEIEFAFSESFRLRNKPYSTAAKYYNETFGGQDNDNHSSNS
jgi:hypothetical protein